MSLSSCYCKSYLFKKKNKIYDNILLQSLVIKFALIILIKIFVQILDCSQSILSFLARLSRQAHKVSLYPCSGVCCRCRCQQCLNIFSSETAWPIKAKLYVEPPWVGGTKVYINGPGHMTMTKMVAMPIYGINL